MPFSSAEIAASIGAFQGQSMNNMAYSQMIGMGGQSGQVDRMAGGMMNRAAAIGGPLAMGAVGLMGLDPMSLGLKAGTAAWGSGAGLMGAGMAGLGVAGAAAGGFALAGYAGNQVMMGAQQQSALNGALRSNFNFQNGQGGQGFSRGDMSQIGGMMRSMTHQLGPEGQMTNFSELTNLAANMGKMGMSGGVRDVQEFGRKFKEMVTTLKSVAQTLGTSLEEAQQFVQSQRSTGMFRASDQLKFSGMARGTAMSGGLALSEVTGMASIGSQISRSVGGLGRQGAFGGMRAIGQIGSALQTGAVSEEDIYNATGLTGAEGRQAMASNMMAQGASFMRSGRGRYFLASMAGKDGALDEESVQNWMNGTMDVGSTKSQANKNLSRVGRANFIRNEGRLRGAALERFGALAPTMAYSQWLSGKGYDPNNMDDKSMLAFQRFSGMGRDEADAAIQMVQKLPEMLTQQRQSAQDDRYGQRVESYRQTHGIEGMKRKMEHMRETINGKLQQVGQDMFTSASDMIEGWFNRTMGITERRTTENINQLWSAAKMGGKGGAEAMQMLGGIGGASRGGSSIMGPDLKAFSRVQGMRSAAEIGGAGGGSADITSFAKSSSGWMRDAYTAQGGLASQTGETRMSSFEKLLQQKAKSGDTSAQGMLARWTNASDSQKAGLLAATEHAAGITDSAKLGATWKEPKLGLGSGGSDTLLEGDRASGKQLLGRESGTFEKVMGTAGGIAALTQVSGLSLGLAALDKVFGDNTSERVTNAAVATGAKLGDMLGHNIVTGGKGNRQEEAAGQYLRSKEGSSAIFRGLSGKGTGALENTLMGLQAQETRSTSEEGQMELIQRSLVASKFAEFQRGAKGSSEAGVKAYAKQILGRDVSLSEAKNMYNSIGSELNNLRAENIRDISGKVSSANDEQKAAYQKMGLATDGKNGMTLSAATMKNLGAKGGQAAQLAMESMNLSSKLGYDTDENSNILGELQKKQGSLYDTIAGMSISEKTKFARTMAGTNEGSMAGESLMRERRLKSAMGRGKGAIGGIASLLGEDLSKEEMEGMKGKDASSVAAFLAGKKGIKDQGFQDELTKSIEAARSGKIGAAADTLNRGIAQSDDAKKKLGEGKKDPQTEMAEAIKTSNRFLEALVRSNDKAVAKLGTLDAIAANTAEGGGGAEEKPSGSNRPR